jgi:hypothetical protein
MSLLSNSHSLSITWAWLSSSFCSSPNTPCPIRNDLFLSFELVRIGQGKFLPTT